MSRFPSRRISLVAALSLAAAAAGAQTGFWRHYSGTINKTLAVQADILAEEGSLTGFYFYEKVGKTIALEGKVTRDGKASMDEKESGEKSTGTISGAFGAEMSSFSGIWKSPDGKKSFPIALREDYGGAARLGAYTVIRGRLLDEDAENSPEATFVGVGIEAIDAQRLRVSMEAELYGGGSAYDRLEKKAASFFEDYAEGNAGVEAEEYDYGMFNWDLTVSALPVFNARGVLCVDDMWWGYTGGAHPNFQNSYYVFDIATGRRLGLESFVRPGSEEALAGLVDAEVRRMRGIKAGSSLVDAGFFVDRVEPAAGNFWVDGSGIYFHYPAYSIAPYAIGTITVFISWKDLGPLSTGHPVTRTP